MKGLTIKIIFFLIAIITITELFLDNSFKEMSNNHFQKTTTQYYNSNKDSIDILIFGTSHAYQTYNPEIIDKSLGTYTFNFGSGAQFMTTTNYLQNEILKSCKPKLIILDVYAIYIGYPKTKENKEAQLKVFDNLNFSLEKVSKTLDIYQKEDMPSVLSQTIRNHNKWNEVLFKEKSKEKSKENNNNLRGYKKNLGNFLDSRKKEFHDFREKDFKLKEVNKSSLGVMTIEQKNLLVHFVKQAKQKKIDVLLLSAPYLNSLYNNYRLNFDSSVKKLADSLEINYLNFNTNFKGLNLEFSDFIDPNHVSVSGANKVTATLSSYLSIKYNMPVKNQNYLKTFLKDISLKKILEENTIAKLSNESSLKNKLNDYLLKNLKKTEKILTKSFQFNKTIIVDEMGYLNEKDNEYAFLFKIKKPFNDNELENFRGYIRYYNGEIKDENKHVISFPMKLIDIEGETYIFVSKIIENINISKFDIFFIQKGTSKASKFFTIKDLKLKKHAN